MNLIVTGATGLVGSRLVQRLAERGDAVTALTRRQLPPNTFPPTVTVVMADPLEPKTWAKLLPDADAVVHLAGENIFAKRWSNAFLAQIRSSRVDSTRVIAEAMAAAPRRVDGTPKVLVSASAIGIYGDRGEETLTETATPGTGVMAEIGVEWEAAATAARVAGVRVVYPRLGIVLDRKGGAVPNLVRPFKLFAGGPIGSGRQFISWIHHADLTQLLGFALDTPTLSGPVNAVAPSPIRNADAGRAIGRILRRPYWLPAPQFALRIVLGRVVEVVCGSQRVLPTVATAAGFPFRYAEFEAAMRDVLRES
jgi:uncharacterized protein